LVVYTIVSLLLSEHLDKLLAAEEAVSYGSSISSKTA
jgi:hypothetical protein